MTDEDFKKLSTDEKLDSLKFNLEKLMDFVNGLATDVRQTKDKRASINDASCVGSRGGPST